MTWWQGLNNSELCWDLLCVSRQTNQTLQVPLYCHLLRREYGYNSSTFTNDLYYTTSIWHTQGQARAATEWSRWVSTYKQTKLWQRPNSRDLNEDDKRLPGTIWNYFNTCWNREAKPWPVRSTLLTRQRRELSEIFSREIRWHWEGQ